VAPLLVGPVPLDPVLLDPVLDDPVLPLELEPDDALDGVVVVAAVDFDSAGSLPTTTFAKISAHAARNTATLMPITHLRILRRRRRRSATRCAAAGRLPSVGPAVRGRERLRGGSAEWSKPGGGGISCAFGRVRRWLQDFRTCL